MTMQITLDGSALDRLFPVGSQARVDLTAAVVNNFVDKLGIKKLKELPADIRSSIAAAVSEANRRGRLEVDEALKEGGLVTQKTWGLDLTDKGKAVVRGEVHAIVSRQVSAALAEVTGSMDLNVLLDQRIRALVGDKLREILADVVDAALRKKFAA